jgi:hypothetical protein
VNAPEVTPEVADAIRTLVGAGITPAQYRAAVRAANPLPTWSEMSDLDKGAAIKFGMACQSEGIAYATENYPCRFLDDPRLVALDKAEASRHADEVLGYEDEMYDLLGEAEYNRLYGLANNYRQG